MSRSAILVVNGFDRRGHFGSIELAGALAFPWIAICLRQIAALTTGDYQVLVLDQSGLPQHAAILDRHPSVRVFRNSEGELTHAEGLDFLVDQTGDDIETLVILDNDCFPLRPGWLRTFEAALGAGAVLGGVYRDEMAPLIRPFIHPSCLFIRRRDLLASGVRFARNMAQDVGQNLTLAVLAGHGRLFRLIRSNRYEAHFLMGGVYGDLVYHQAAGGRQAGSWLQRVRGEHENVRLALRRAAFRDLDGLVAALTGQRRPRVPGLRLAPRNGSLLR